MPGESVKGEPAELKWLRGPACLRVKVLTQKISPVSVTGPGVALNLIQAGNVPG